MHPACKDRLQAAYVQSCKHLTNSRIQKTDDTPTVRRWIVQEIERGKVLFEVVAFGYTLFVSKESEVWVFRNSDGSDVLQWASESEFDYLMGKCIAGKIKEFDPQKFSAIIQELDASESEKLRLAHLFAGEYDEWGATQLLATENAFQYEEDITSRSQSYCISAMWAYHHLQWLLDHVL